MELHNIDKPDGNYTNPQLDEFMVFCILDTAVPYEMVCRTFDALKSNGMTQRKNIRKYHVSNIVKVLRSSGYRFPNQHARRIWEFGYNEINLKTATREDIIKNINGIHYKLASMFLRNTRGLDYAVMDVHTRRWLRNWLQNNSKLTTEKIKKLTYEQEEDYFKAVATLLCTTTKELDLKIWDENRVGNRIEKKI